jgi:hypothetical protein
MRLLAIILLCGLFALDVYRAATQSLVHDEALTWQFYLTTPFSTIFTVYDANNHFLHTVLLRFVTGFLGYSEFTMRIPALASAALLLWSIFRLGLLVFGETWLLPLFVFLAAANPLVLDFQVAARGYGMALALFFFALERLVRFTSAPQDRKLLWHAAVGFSLSVMANLVFVVPAGVVALAFAAIFPRPAAPEPGKKPKRGPAAPPPPSLWRDFFAPVAALAVLFLLVLPLNDMQGDKFYVGVDGIAASAAGLSLTLAARNEAAARVIGWGLAPLAIIAGLYFSRRPKSASQTALWLASTALAGSWVLLVLAHLATGMLLPVDRTGVYFFPLLALVLCCLAPLLRWVPAAVGIALAVVYVVQLDATRFWVWRYDADTRTLLRELERRQAGKSEPLRLGISWQLEPSVNFYRETQGWKWLEPASRRDVRPGLDAYLLIDQDRGLIQALGVTVDRTGRASGTMLAFPSR